MSDPLVLEVETTINTLVIETSVDALNIDGPNAGPPGPRGYASPDVGGAGSPVVPSIVWRPGQPTQDFSYETFDEIEALMADDPQMRILLDDTDGECIVLRDLECNSRTIWESAHPGTDAVAYLKFAAGAKLLNPYRFNAVGVVKSETGGPVIEMSIGGRLVFDDACVMYSTSGVNESIVSINCAAAQILFLNGSNCYQLHVSPTCGIVAIDYASPSTVVMVFRGSFGNSIFSTTLEGRAGDTAYIFADDSWFWPPQTFFVGTTSVTRTSRSENTLYANGPTASRPAVAVAWQTYGDTTLGIPIWWNGSNWVNSAGTTV